MEFSNVAVRNTSFSCHFLNHFMVYITNNHGFIIYMDTFLPYSHPENLAVWALVAVPVGASEMKIHAV